MWIDVIARIVFAILFYFGNFGYSIIGGVVDGVGNVTPGTNDFWIYWDPATLSPYQVAYSTVGSTSFYISNFSRFSITPAATASVPEPFTIIGSLIGGTAAFRMKKKLSDANKG